MTFFKINDRQYIELFPEREPGSDRLNHISLQTGQRGSHARVSRLEGHKGSRQSSKGRIGNSNFNIKDPEGHTVEIVQYDRMAGPRKPTGSTCRRRVSRTASCMSASS